MENKVGRALRRGVALGLVLAAAWGVSLMADLGVVGDGLAGLGEEPALAVTLMAAQLGELPGGAKGLTGWRRLLHKHRPTGGQSRPVLPPPRQALLPLSPAQSPA